MNKRNIFLITGFVFFFMGFISIIFNLVGLKLDPIGFLYDLGNGFAFLIHIIMVCGGVALMYLGKNLGREELEE